MKVKILSQKDCEIWRNFRLEALKNSPDGFSSSYEEECDLSVAHFQKSLDDNAIFGAFINDILVSSLGFHKLNMLKTSHSGIIWGMYTQPEYRGQGVASTVIENVVTYAKTQVMQLYLTCMHTNYNAIKLYKKHGFKIYATKPRSVKVKNVFLDEQMMILDLRGSN